MELSKPLTCPIHKDVILYNEDGDPATSVATRIVIFGARPVYCKQCDKSYYKEECVVWTGDEE